MNKSKDKKSRYDHYMRLWYMSCPLPAMPVFDMLEIPAMIRWIG